MPNIQSAMKRMRSDAKKHELNLDCISEIKTLSQKLARTTDAKEAKEIASLLVSRYDRAVSRGIVPRGRADRRKSRIAHYLAKLSIKK